MPKCSLCGKLGNNKENSSFHRFPRDEVLRKKWVEIIGREGWMPTNTSVLCSDHFTEESFILYFNRKRIIPGALPIRYSNEPQRDQLVERLHITNFKNNSQDCLIKQENESIQKVNLHSHKNSYSKRSTVIVKHETPLSESQDPLSFFVIEKAPEPSIVLEYDDCPSKEEELGVEISLAHQKLELAVSPKSKKRKLPSSETAYEKILHDHHYDSSLETEKEKFKNCRKKLDSVQRENKTLRQLVRRLTKRVASLTGVVKELEAKELLSDGEHSSHKYVSAGLKTTKNRKRKKKIQNPGQYRNLHKIKANMG